MRRASKNLRPTGILAAVLLFAPVDDARALLIGDTVTVMSDYGAIPGPPPMTLTATDTVVVGPGLELIGDGSNNHSNQGGNSFLLAPGDSIDIGADSMTFTFTPFIGPFAFITRFTDLQWVGGPGPGLVQSVSIFDPNGLVNPGAQAFPINGGTGVEFQGTLNGNPLGSTFTLDLTVVHTPVPPAVPEPATVLIFAAGLVALGALKRSRGRPLRKQLP